MSGAHQACGWQPWRGLILGIVLSASAASACPKCATSRLVSAIVYGEHFWRTAAAVLAPFPIFALIVACLYRIDRPTGEARPVLQETPCRPNDLTAAR